MSIKNSLAQKKRWAKLPKKHRSATMSQLASLRHSKMSAKEKKAEGKRLAKARAAKSMGV